MCINCYLHNYLSSLFIMSNNAYKTDQERIILSCTFLSAIVGGDTDIIVVKMIGNETWQKIGFMPLHKILVKNWHQQLMSVYYFHFWCYFTFPIMSSHHPVYLREYSLILNKKKVLIFNTQSEESHKHIFCFFLQHTFFYSNEEIKNINRASFCICISIYWIRPTCAQGYISGTHSNNQTYT